MDTNPVKLTSPDGLTTIELNAYEVSESVQNETDASPLGENPAGVPEIIHSPANWMHRTIEISALLSAGGVPDKATLESLEAAYFDWIIDEDNNRGRALLQIGTKDGDVTARDHWVIITSLDTTLNVERNPAAYDVTIVCEEAGTMEESG